jgi:hypothetical protein
VPDIRRRLIAFATLTAICVGAVCLYAVYATNRSTAEVSPSGIRVVDDANEVVQVAASDRALFRMTTIGRGYGKVAIVRLDEAAGPRYLTDLTCDRVDFAEGRGVCLTADRGVFTTYRALIFNDTFEVLHNVGLGGIPSRTRVSPDGRIAAVTVFVSGHSYAAGSFSTQTTLVDTTTGAVFADLELFSVTRDGAPFKAVDFNFWGVTFAADSDTFYATLGTGGRVLLVRGSASARTATVLRDGIECPSLSPDGTRLAFKRRGTQDGRFVWRLATLDLTTMAENVIAGETRSVDDQVEWLDATHLVYAIADEESGFGGTSIWTVNVDTGGPAALWLRGAYSPSVVLQKRP